MRILSFLFFLIISNVSFAQNNTQQKDQLKTREEREREFQEKLRKQIERDRKEMEQFFQSSDFKMLRNRMHQLLESFGEYDDLNIDDILNQSLRNQGFGQYQLGNNDIETSWRDTSTEKIFVIKATANKNDPFNITVEKGMIKINGTATIIKKNDKGRVTSKSFRSINFSQSIPRDVDENSVRYDQDKDGNLLVIFKRKAPVKIRKSKDQKKRDDSMKPLKVQENDITI